MRRAASIAATSLSSCIAASHPMVHEHRLAAQFEHGCRAAGAQRMAYPPVVAGGADACTIHYSRNDKVGEEGGSELSVWGLGGIVKAEVGSKARILMDFRNEFQGSGEG